MYLSIFLFVNLSLSQGGKWVITFKSNSDLLDKAWLELVRNTLCIHACTCIIHNYIHTCTCMYNT